MTRYRIIFRFVMQPWGFPSIPHKTVPSPPMQRVGSGSSGCAEAALLFTQQLPTARKGSVMQQAKGERKRTCLAESTLTTRHRSRNSHAVITFAPDFICASGGS